MKHLQRCWEYMRCQEQFGCAAYPDHGEDCWLVAGTMRADTDAERRLGKQKQRAYDDPNLSEAKLAQFNTAPKKLCKYVERYGMCRCCPYYQYVEKEKKDRKQARGMEF